MTMDNEKKIEIPFGAFDSELIHQEINIPNGFKAVIDGNKIILTRAESEDEEIKKWLIGYFRQYKEDGMEKYANGLKVESIIAWLEKQGESYTKKDVDNAYIEGMASAKRELEKQGEQKPTDKVEPKFKVGDWITNNEHNNVAKVLEINNEQYRLDYCDTIVTISVELIDNDYHLWTIQDAKEGDVLAGSEKDVILMFRRIGNTEWDDVIDYHCYYDCYRENFIVQKDVQYWGNTENNQLNPSTKEQRDILFQKMKEAGYEWDAEKKKLNKISQRMVSAEAKEAMYDKPAWSEEDEEFLRRAINAAKDVYPMTANWLKALKQRIGG